MNWLVSRHVKWLESEIADLKKRHDVQLTDLKLSHQAEMDRLLAENNRLQDEVNGIRIALGQPPSKQEAPEPDRPKPNADPDAMPVFTGSPWERVVQREQWMDSPSGRRWMKKNWEVAAPIGETEKPKENASAPS